MQWITEKVHKAKKEISGAKEQVGGFALKFLYRKYLDGRKNSTRYSLATGYSSSNYLHCMAVDSKDQFAEIHNQSTSFQALERAPVLFNITFHPQHCGWKNISNRGHLCTKKK